jgi:hypothetical protein
MGLTEEMRAAVDAPPPSGIDLDELVRQGRARRTRSRAALGVAGLAGFVAVALAAVGAYSLTAAPKTNHPVGVGAPPATAHAVATPPTTRVIIQLQDAVQAFPASLHVPDNVHFNYGGKQPGSQAALGYYYASWTFNHVDYGVNVFVGDGHPVGTNEDGCDANHRGDPALGCDQVIDQFGVTITVSNATTASTQRTTTVDNFRSNGCVVMVDAVGHGTAQIPAKADIQAASHVPGLSVTK